MKTDKKQIFPEKELIEYEKVTTMTAEEQAALRTWVAEGNSVHENASMGVDETGEPLDFLEVYRMEEEIRQDLEKLSPTEKDKYIARLKGEYTVEILLEDIQALHFKLNSYERILKKHHLLDEAENLMDDWKNQAVVLPEIADNAELPFQERLTIKSQALK